MKTEIWTYEKCKEEALKFKSKSDLKKFSNRAYRIINSNKWYELLTHLSSKITNWSYEKCKMEALEYKTKKEFRQTKAYSTIIKNGWHEIIKNLPNERHNKWTYDECKEAALQFTKKNELRKNYGGAYQAIRDNKWYELFDHMSIIGNKYNRLVYVYEFKDNYCYIGLTCNIDRRNRQHLTDDMESYVYKHIKKTNLIPTLILKSDYLKIENSIIMEESVLQTYKEQGWNILNKVKTGSIGGNTLIWTKEACEEEIRKFKSLKEFRENSKGAHNSMYVHGWKRELLDKYFPNRKKSGNKK